MAYYSSNSIISINSTKLVLLILIILLQLLYANLGKVTFHEAWKVRWCRGLATLALPLLSASAVRLCKLWSGVSEGGLHRWAVRGIIIALKRAGFVEAGPPPLLLLPPSGSPLNKSASSLVVRLWVSTVLKSWSFIHLLARRKQKVALVLIAWPNRFFGSPYASQARWKQKNCPRFDGPIETRAIILFSPVSPKLVCPRSPSWLLSNHILKIITQPKSPIISIILIVLLLVLLIVIL